MRKVVQVCSAFAFLTMLFLGNSVYASEENNCNCEKCTCEECKCHEEYGVSACDHVYFPY